MKDINKYCEQASMLMTKIESGNISEYEFVYSIAQLQIEYGDESAGKAVMEKYNGMMRDYANKFILKLMGTEFVHVNACIRDFVEVYLYGGSAKAFMESCIDCWQHSDREIDQDFGFEMWKKMCEYFSDLASALYCGASDVLVSTLS